MQSSQENLDRWARVAAFWEAHRAVIRTMFTPITQALVEDAGVAPGQTVLDVSTGPGEPALQLIETVGSGGRVEGIDPIPEMIAGARRTAERLGINNVRFEVASVEALPFGANHFDAAVCRLGVMFFPSPVDGVREMLRVLKPGRRLAFAVWHEAERNPFFHTLSRVMDRYVAPTPAEADPFDAFRFAPAGKLRGILAEAGAEAATERVLQFPIRAPLSLENFWRLRVGLSDKYRQKVATLSEKAVAEVKGQVIESLREYSTPDGIVFPSEVRIVSGSKRLSA